MRTELRILHLCLILAFFLSIRPRKVPWSFTTAQTSFRDCMFIRASFHFACMVKAAHTFSRN